MDDTTIGGGPPSPAPPAPNPADALLGTPQPSQATPARNPADDLLSGPPEPTVTPSSDPLGSLLTMYHQTGEAASAGLARGGLSSLAQLPDIAENTRTSVNSLQDRLSKNTAAKALISPSMPVVDQAISHALDSIHSAMGPVSDALQGMVDNILPEHPDYSGDDHPMLSEFFHKGGDVVGNLMGAVLLSKVIGTVGEKAGAISEPNKLVGRVKDLNRAAASMQPTVSANYGDLNLLPDINTSLGSSLDDLVNHKDYNKVKQIALDLEDSKGSAKAPPSTTPTVGGNLPVQTFDSIKRFFQRQSIQKAASSAGLNIEDAQNMKSIISKAIGDVDAQMPQVPDPENPGSTISQYALTRQLGQQQIIIKQGAQLISKKLTSPELGEVNVANGKLPKEINDIATGIEKDGGGAVGGMIRPMINAFRYRSGNPLGRIVSTLMNGLTSGPARNDEAVLGNVVRTLGAKGDNAGKAISIIQDGLADQKANAPGYMAGQWLKYLPYATVKGTGVLDSQPNPMMAQEVQQ